MLWCRRSPRRTGPSPQRPSGVYVDLDTSSTEVQKRTAERVSEESADATWRRERAAREAREKADETQRCQAQRARRADTAHRAAGLGRYRACADGGLRGRS